MTSARTSGWLLLLLLAGCFSLAAHLQPQFQLMQLNDTRKAWVVNLHGALKPVRFSRSEGDIFQVALGDSRRLFANTFYTKADEYYHSGYYPTMFDDNTAFRTTHMAADTGAVNSKNRGDEHGFLGPTRNWIDAFGRHFFPDRHTHLDENGPDNLGDSDEVREILPWLKLSSDLDPDNVQTYTVTAFWLRQRMNNPREADAVLHEGLRNCPGSYEILFELGRLYSESYHDLDRARNVWRSAYDHWNQAFPELNPEEQNDSRLVAEQITTHLAELAEKTGQLAVAMDWLKKAQAVSANNGAIIQTQVDRLQYKLGQEFNPLLKPLY